MSILIHDGNGTSRQHDISLRDKPFVPPGFPDSITGQMVWTGSDYAGDEEYAVQLSALDIAEIESALQYFKALKLPTTKLCKNTFPLSDGLTLRLHAISDAVHTGRGFCVLRGVDPSRYGDRDNALIFAGIASYIGHERSDMRHVFDARKGHKESNTALRPTDIAVKMQFHTDVDRGDILALYVQNRSSSGGMQSVVSFWKVYNDLVNENPLVLGMLAKNWRYEVPWSDHMQVTERPVIYYHSGKLMINYAKAFLIGSPYDSRLPDGTPISDAQRRAIAVFEETCQKNGLRLSQKRGDMLFVNNLSILHARDEFEDNVAHDQSRHVINLMLRDIDKAWKQPLDVSRHSQAEFEQPWAREVLVRGEAGIRQDLKGGYTFHHD